MVSQALRPEIGAVGARILDQDNSIQRAGIVLGVGGSAGHAFRKLPSASEGYMFRSAGYSELLSRFRRLPDAAKRGV